MRNTAERSTSVGGIPTRYLVAGEGPPVVLLHALEEDASDWLPCMDQLASSYRLYALDLPGITAGTAPIDDYSPTSFAGFLSAFLEALGIERPALVGNSLGGLVALRLALSSPDRISSLTLIASGGLGTDVSPFLRMQALPVLGDLSFQLASTPWGAAQRAWGRALLLFGDVRRVPGFWWEAQYSLALSQDVLRSNLTALRAQVDAYGQREVVLDELPHLTVPALILWGTCDQLVPVRQAHEAMSRLADGTLVLVAGCGHLPHIEGPFRVAGALREFFLQHPPA